MTHRFAIALLVGSVAMAAASDPDLAAKRDRQAQVQADTDQLARRLGTMLRVLEHYKLDEAGEKKLLNEAAVTLAGLSQQQMSEVLTKLDAAMQAADAETSTKNLTAAYEGHREALRKLKGLLGRFDAIRDLDTATLRIDKLARDELELSFRVADVLQDSLDSVATDANRRRRAVRTEFPSVRAKHDADEQADYCKSFSSIVQQLGSLKYSLKPDDMARLDRAFRLALNSDLTTNMVDLATRIRPADMIEERNRDWMRAVNGGWAVSGQLQEMAETLRMPRDKVQLLRESRQKVAILIEELSKEMRESVEFFSQPPTPPVERAFGRRMAIDDPTSSRARQHADTASRLGHAARTVGYQMATQAPTPATHLANAAETIHLADQAFRRIAPLFARPLQLLAESQLRLALNELDATIAKTATERSDALAATKAALDQIDKLIKDQKQLREDTLPTIQNPNSDVAKKQATKQQELAKQGADVADMPLPAGSQTKSLLKDAAQSMDNAARDLSSMQPKPASEKQLEAVSRLEEARKELTDIAKNIEQRRDDIAKLETAGEKLKELAKEQHNVAADAQKAPDGREVAKAQDKVTPPTKDVAKDLQQTAPEAARSTDKAAERMEAAKDALQKNEMKDGAANADEAAQQLDRANSQVAKELAKKRAQEAIDQSKMQPNQFDLMQATQDMAKAMDAANDATKASEEAMNSPMVKDLLDRQKKVAAQATESGQDKAAEPAKNAAKDLEKGDLQDAVAQQQKALKQLQKNELANEQKSIMDTTQALAKSMESTEMAQSAVQQAMAQSPEALQRQLEKASKELDKAGQQLQKGQPQQANQAQEQAKDAIDQAMQALQQAAEMAQNMPKNQQPGKPANEPQPGQQQPSPDNGDQVATGDRKPGEPGKNVKAQSNGVEGDGTFLNLPARQRELIRQTLTEKLPPEYASFIQQYFVNIAKGKAPVNRDAKPAERSAKPAASEQTPSPSNPR